MQIVKNDMCLTYIIRKEPVKMGPNRGDPLQVHHNPPSNETILHGLALKYDSVQGSEIVIYKIQK